MKNKLLLTLTLSLVLFSSVFAQVLTIPVVVHVVWNNAQQNITDAQVLSQIDVLNEDFGRQNADTVNTPAGFLGLAANTEIQFCLAQTDPNGLPTTGITRRQTTQASFTPDDKVKSYATGGENAWDVTKYFNIWVCNLSSGMIGYGEFPTATASNTYGVVMHYQYFGRTGNVAAPYDKGRSCTHTLAHCFNLLNLNADAACLDLDSVPDTPTPSVNTYGCSTYPLLDACNPSAPGVMFMNFMSYADDSCMNLFTHGQKARMRNLLASPPYSALTTSTACLPLSVGPSPQSGSLTLYPNPAVHSITLQSGAPLLLPGQVTLCNTLGQTMPLRFLSMSANKAVIDVSTLTPGIWLIRCAGSTLRFTRMQ